VTDIEIVPPRVAGQGFALKHQFDFSGMDLAFADILYDSLDEAEHAAAGIMAAIAGSSD